MSRLNSAELILDMLHSQNDASALSGAMLGYGLDDLLIKCARADNSLDLRMQRICLRILLKFVEQPALHSSLFIVDIYNLLLEACNCYLHSFPSDGSPKVVAAMLQLLYADGATLLAWTLIFDS